MRDGLKRGCAGWAKRDCSVGSKEGLCRMGQRGTVRDVLKRDCAGWAKRDCGGWAKRDCAGWDKEGLCGMG